MRKRTAACTTVAIWNARVVALLDVVGATSLLGCAFDASAAGIVCRATKGLRGPLTVGATHRARPGWVRFAALDPPDTPHAVCPPQLASGDLVNQRLHFVPNLAASRGGLRPQLRRLVAGAPRGVEHRTVGFMHYSITLSLLIWIFVTHFTVACRGFRTVCGTVSCMGWLRVCGVQNVRYGRAVS